MPPFPGNDLPGVISYRDIKDTDEMIDAAAKYKHAVVIGAGLLGWKWPTVWPFARHGRDRPYNSAWIMERQLDSTAGKMLQAEPEKRA